VSSSTGSRVPASAKDTEASTSSATSASRASIPASSSIPASRIRSAKAEMGSRFFHSSTSSLERYSSGSNMEWARKR
jgi:hypothetical protein